MSGMMSRVISPAGSSSIRVRVAMAHEAKRRTEERRSLKLKKRFTSLTPSEHKVMSLLILDMRNKEIGKKLNISHRTVEVHRSRVMEKMKAESLLELMEMARAGGLIEMTRSSKRKCDI